jgi:alkylhydroperoxidase/carboxymuconolactone decarboxylase family protein YurZ
MKDIGTILAEDRLGALRAAYDHDAMTAAEVQVVSTVVPQFRGWNEEIARTFYQRPETLAPRDRERCLIALITCSGPPVSLALHIYWGLMEGLSVAEVVQTIGLAGCYGGLPKASFGIEVSCRVLKALGELPATGDLKPPAVLSALVREFSPRL